MNELLPKEDRNSVTTELKRYSQQRSEVMHGLDISA